MTGAVEAFEDRPLTQKDRGAAADLLADAFYDNPAHIFIYPDDDLRRDRLRWLMRTNLGAQMIVGRSFARRKADGSIAAMGFWHAPGAPTANLFQLARFGFFAMPLKHGWAAFQRMLKTVEALETRRADALDGRRSWYLNNMVVAADDRGKGLGGATLARELAETVDPSGAPASLTTQKLENVSFYRRMGFEVADDAPVEAEGGAFANWIMIREAGAAEKA